MNRFARLCCTVVVAGVLTFLPTARSTGQKASSPKTPDIVAMGQPQVMQLLLLMEADNAGKVSREEWMEFMAAEFDRLDKAKAGEVNLKELKESNSRPVRLAALGK